MTTIGPGAGQQHLIALMRTLRSRLEDEVAEIAHQAAPTGSGSAGTGALGTGGPGGAGTPTVATPGGAGTPGTSTPGSAGAPGTATPGGAGTPNPAAPGTAVPGSGGQGPSGPLPPGNPGIGAPPGTPPSPTGPGGLYPPALAGLPLPAPGNGLIAPGAPLLRVPGQMWPPADGGGPADLPHLVGGGLDGDAVLRDLQRALARCLVLAGPVDELVGRLRATLAEVQPQLLVPLPGPAENQREQLRAALTWLVDNLDRPQVVAAGCGQLGGVLREWGITPQQVQLVGAALAEALRASLGEVWRRDLDAAWRTTWRLAHRWLADGAAAAAYTPVVWSGVVVGHQLRRSDLAVLWIRPYLPYRFVPGQYAVLEVAQLPGVWRPYSLGGAPRLDNLLELHVRAKDPAGVSGALVYDTRVGDRIRLRPAAGESVLDPAGTRDLLLIAGDTGVAPMKALLAELAVTADERSAVLFWGARTLDDLYDIGELEALAAMARRVTVVPVIAEGDPGPYASGLVTEAIAAYGQWSEHEVFLAGPPQMVAATRPVLHRLGVDEARIHHDPPTIV